MTASQSSPQVGSDAAGREIDQAEPRVFPCESCGADLEFAIDAQSLKCPYCAHVVELEFEQGAAVEEQDLRAAIEQVAERRCGGVNTMEGVQQVRCVDCGAQVRFSGTLTSQECPYCATPIQLDGVHDAEDRIAVDGVLPFFVERDKARANLKAWVQSRWFAPSAFKQRSRSRRHWEYMSGTSSSPARASIR